MLPEKSRSSAYEAQYKQPTVIGSDASLSSLSQPTEQFAEGTSQKFSELSWMLPEKTRTSAYEIQYKEPTVVGSDASLSPLSTGANNYERSQETLGPKTSPMLDWFGAVKSNPDASYSNAESSNELRDVATYYTPTPTLRTNDSFGKYSANIGIGGSDALGGFSRGEGIRQKGTALYMVGAGFGGGG